MNNNFWLETWLQEEKKKFGTKGLFIKASLPSNGHRRYLFSIPINPTEHVRHFELWNKESIQNFTIEEISDILLKTAELINYWKS